VAFFVARQAAGALGTRLSLRPLFSFGRMIHAKLGQIMPREGGLVSENWEAVIARSECDDPPSLAVRAMAGLESAEAPLRVGGSNPFFSFRGEVDCFAGARNDEPRTDEDGLQGGDPLGQPI
jgi:hypothetical protein